MKAIYFLLLVLFLQACTASRIVRHNLPGLNDYKHFPYHTAQAPVNPTQFLRSATNLAPDSIMLRPDEHRSFSQFLKNTNTVAFLVLRNDSLIYEQYLRGYEAQSLVPSYSMAKSVTSILIGCAIDEGLIDSVNIPVRALLPELSAKYFDHLRLIDVLQMTTGLRFNEGYANPFGSVARLYYGANMRRSVRHMRTDTNQRNFAYKSGNTQILGALLEAAIHRRYPNKSITDYLQEKLWQPLGMEFAATWSLDSRRHKMEKTFCCLNACARDYAKIGLLYLHKGQANGQQIVSKSWVEASTRIDVSNGSAWFYQYQWWLPSHDGDFYARGVLGQYIYVNPKKNLVIVRLGKGLGGVNWGQFFVNLAKYY